MAFLKKIFDFFLFTSLFIALCAIAMVNQTYTLFIQHSVDLHYLAFVFFSTVCSYNFHWMLTAKSSYPSFRLNWSVQHKGIHIFLFIAGIFTSAWFFFYLSAYWIFIGIAAIFTFLYSSPKLSFPFFAWLKKIAFGKPILLALVWTYVTAILPLVIENKIFNYDTTLYCCSQFFFIFSLCIIFDYRDREDDLAEGIRSLISYFSERGINILFIVSILLAAICHVLLIPGNISVDKLIVLFIPVLLIAFLFNNSKKNFSDYFYYFILDGLLMLPGLLLLIMKLF